MKFSTHDSDNDIWSAGNCATAAGGSSSNGKSGGWWFQSCENCNPNGINYGPSATVKPNSGIHWNGFGGPSISLKSVQMAIRPMV